MSNPLNAPRGLDDPSRDLPEGWLASRLAAKCEIFGGGRLQLTKEKDYRSSGVTAFSAAGPDGYVDAVEIDGREGVVLSAIGANCGRCFFASGQWTTLANIQAIIPKADLDANYLFYYVNRDGYWTRSGSAQPFIKPSSIQTSWVAYPSSKLEQSKIAEVLSTVDRAIAQTEALIAKHQRIKTGLMQDLLTRGIDEAGQLRSEATHAFKDSPLGRIPVEWEVDSLASSFLSSPQNGLYKPESEYSAAGIPIVRIDGFQQGGVIGAQILRRLHVGQLELTTFGLQPGDILVNRVNTIDLVGKAAIVGNLLEPTVFESNMMRVRLDKKRLLSEFCIRLLTTPYARRFFSIAAKPAVAQASINQLDVGALLVAFPSLREQKLIVERLNLQAGALSVCTEQLQKLRHLKTALMQDLLTGKVRVTPLLEPAKEAIA